MTIWYAITLLVLYGYISHKKYKSILNPVFFPFAYTFFATVIIGYLALGGNEYLNKNYINKAYGLSLASGVGYIIGSLLKVKPLENLLIKFANSTIDVSNNKFRKVGVLYARRVLLFGILCFIMLVFLKSPLWITDPRTAYMDRQGVGVFWAVFATSIPLSLLIYLSAKKLLPGTKLYLITTVFLMLGYFTGSKQTILSTFLAVIFYVNYNIKILSFVKLSIFITFSLLFFASLAVLQGSFGNLLSAVAYFDHIKTTASALEAIKDTELQYGSTFLSGFWSYVPRGLYPEKPLNYGVNFINEELFPGAAEIGYTPALYSWFGAYFDFGASGVFLDGLLSGFVNAMIFNTYLRKKANLFLFLISCGAGFGIFNMPSYALGFILTFIITYAIASSSKRRRITALTLKPRP